MVPLHVDGHRTGTFCAGWPTARLYFDLVNAHQSIPDREDIESGAIAAAIETGDYAVLASHLREWSQMDPIRNGSTVRCASAGSIQRFAVLFMDCCESHADQSREMVRLSPTRDDPGTRTRDTPDPGTRTEKRDKRDTISGNEGLCSERLFSVRHS